MNKATAQEVLRIKYNIQCHECYGVQIERFEDRFGGKDRFECKECGCTWHKA